MLQSFYKAAKGNSAESCEIPLESATPDNKRNISDTSIADNSLEPLGKQGRLYSSSPSRDEDKELTKYIESMFNSLHDKLDSSMNSVVSRIDVLCDKFTLFEAQAAANQADIANLKQQVSGLEQKNCELSGRVLELEACREASVVTEPSWQPNGSGDIKIALIGDSNSAGKLKFGEGKGTLGSALLGAHAFCPTVEEIPAPDSEIYGGASDIIIAVGTNDLKVENCAPENLVLNTFNHVRKISKSHPSAHIFLPGVLPVCSSDGAINNKIKRYNFYMNDMCKSLPRVSFIDMKPFNTYSGSLQAKFARGESDPLHLNEVGLKLYFSRFKYALRCRHNLPIPKRSYSNVARSRQETVPSRSNPVSNRGREGGRMGSNRGRT